MNDDNFIDSPREELDDALRQAVDRVRSQPMPAESRRRALEKARQIGAVYRSPWRGVGKRVLALAALVALILVCSEMLRQKPEAVVRAEREAKIRELRERLDELRKEEPPARFGNDFDFLGDDDRGRAVKKEMDELVRTLRELEREEATEAEKLRKEYDGQKRGYLDDLRNEDPKVGPTGTKGMPRPPIRPAQMPVSGPVGAPGTVAPAPTPTSQPPGEPSLDPLAFGATKGGESFSNAAPNVIGDGGVSGTGQASQRLSALKIAENWGKLPEADRAKAMLEMQKNVPPQYQAVIQNYFQALGKEEKGDETRTRLITAIKEVDQRDAVTTRANQAAKKIANSWGDLPDKDREKALLLLTEVKEQKGKADKLHLLYVKKAVDEATYKEAAEKLKSLQTQLDTFTATRVAEKPQVWYRDPQRPSVARVYVGDGNSLDLVSMHVSVTIEGPRARTVVDHIFKNPHARQLEGTFEYPMPTGASASYFAMFAGKTAERVPARFARKAATAPDLPSDAWARTPAQLAAETSTDDWGNPMEARIVNKQRALETYEEIVRGRIDPGLLEYAGGNTFSGRVFPIPQKGYSRVIFAYEELLPFTQATLQYRFPLPNKKIDDLQVALTYSKADGQKGTFTPEDATRSERAGQISFVKKWSDASPAGDVRFACTPPRGEIQTVTGRQGENGPIHLYARIRPHLKVAETKPFAEHALFLLDTSLSEHPDRFAVNMKLLRKILESDTSIKKFNVVTFDVAARRFFKDFVENTAKSRDDVFQQLDGIVLEGATNLSAALDQVSAVSELPINVFLLSDGQVTWGDADVPSLVSRFERRCKNPTRFHCYRTGLGADNLEAFEALTRRGGGIFQCYGEADLAAAAVAHRHHCFQVERVSIEGTPETGDLLVGGRRAAIYPGGELVIAARAFQPGKSKLVLEGTYQGERITKSYGVEFAANGELAARGWAEVAVASLLSLNDPKLDPLVTAYCQQFGIGSKVASFLILENPDDYKRLNLEAERGRTVPGGDLGVFLDQSWKQAGAAVTPRIEFARFLERIEGRVALKKSPQGEHVSKLLALLTDDDFELPEELREGTLVHWKDVPEAYEAARTQNRRDPTAYLNEANRRAAARDPAGAVRALSSIVEEFPTRSDALRLVGYRLLDLEQPGAAARLFRRVQESRPFEPHSYRDLARSLEDSGKYGLAAVQYEIVLAGTWHNRFHDSLKQVTLEEYASMMRQAIRQRKVSKDIANHFGERLEHLFRLNTQSDLRVTISWNTDATDVDLWVVEPDGTKCYYQNKSTKNGGELSQDQTQGYGPERYQVAKAKPGTYTIYAHYYRMNQNLLAGETHVNVIVTEFAGTPQERSRRHTITLKKNDEQVEVTRVRFPMLAK